MRVRVRGAEGFTLLEMIFVTALIALLSAMAVPTIFRSKLAANETSAIASLRVIHSGQLAHTLTCGFGLYSVSFPDLADPSGDGFLPADFTASPTFQRSGYDFNLVAGGAGLSGLTDCNGAGTSTEYYVTAVPITVGATGARGFASSHASVIWQDTTGLAPVEPFAVAGTVSEVN